MKKPVLQLCTDCGKPIPPHRARMRCRKCARLHNYRADDSPPIWVLPGPVNTMMEKHPNSSSG